MKQVFVKKAFVSENTFGRTLLAIFLAVMSLSFSANGQTPTKHQLTASYIYNFAKNIEWPNESQEKFTIGLYRVENPQLVEALSYLNDNLTVRGKQISVIEANTIKSLKNYHLVYTDVVSNTTIDEIYKVIDGRPTLLVTSDYANKQLVMINMLTTDARRLLFEVNKSNIINQGLKPLPELILNGGSEIDVAKLFREGQASLVAMQKQLTLRESTLLKLTSSIKGQEEKNRALEYRLEELNSTIAKSNDLIAQQSDKLESQIEQINDNKKEREKLLSDVRNSEQALKAQRSELIESQQKLNAIREEIAVRERRLGELKLRVEKQDDEIKEQKGEINELDELVASQQRALMYSRGMVLLAVLLVITAVAAYLIKRRDNLRLAAHSQDLQMARDRLAIAKQKAEDASQAKSEFLSLMSHELRTPLQAIIGYTDVVIEELKLDGTQAHVDDLSRVISNSERLLKLINRVLDLAKMESGKMELDLTEVRLSTLIDEAVSSIKPQFEKNGNQLNVKVVEGKTPPVADPEKLLHILINLLGNATKFTHNGVVDLTVSNNGNALSIAVKDTGIGMSQDQQAQIFDRFRQADSSATRNYGGSGLGLAITHQFCTMMGGTISVESQRNVGSTFSLNIPLPITVNDQKHETPLSIKRDVEEISQNIQTDSPNIVMIDDDPAFLDIMARSMVKEGYAVKTAGNAKEGFRLAKHLRPNVITLDVQLPDTNGWELYERIKSDPDLKNIPVVVISIGDYQKRHHKTHVDEYLTKPIGRDALARVVQKLAPINA